MKRQSLRHILGTNNPRKFEIYIIALISYFIKAIKENNIDKMVGFYSPHSFGDHVLLCCAHALNIESIIFDTASSTASLSKPLVRAYNSSNAKHVIFEDELQKNYESADSALEELYTRICSNPTPYSQAVLENEKMRRSLSNKNILKKLKSSDINTGNKLTDALSLKEESLRLIRNHEVELSPDKKYVLMTLHVEPEATTCPQGHRYYDQLLFAQGLTTMCEKFGLKLIFLEHPNQIKAPLGDMLTNLHIYSDSKISSRTIYFYNFLLNSPASVGFYNRPTSKEILENPNIISVASINGAFGIQAAVHKKIGITGPKNWYGNLKNIFTLDEILDKDTFPDIGNVSMNDFVEAFNGILTPRDNILTWDKNNVTRLKTSFVDFLPKLTKTSRI